MSKYCPSCGKQTLYETDDSSYDDGNRCACYSCGFNTWMSEFEPMEYTAELGKVEEYKPMYSTTEMILARINGNFVQLLDSGRSLFEEKWSEDYEAYLGNHAGVDRSNAKTITFRRYDPLPPVVQNIATTAT